MGYTLRPRSETAEERVKILLRRADEKLLKGPTLEEIAAWADRRVPEAMQLIQDLEQSQKREDS